MKKTIIAVALMGMTVTCQASPLADFVIGVTFLGVGGGFELLRNQTAKDKEDDDKKAGDAAISTLQHDEAASYFQGAADWEFIQNGNTSSYRSFSDTAASHRGSALRFLAETNRFAESASDHRDKEKIYKGVSLTSFGVGGAFIIKSAVTYLIQRNQTASLEKKYKWVRNFEFKPTRQMDGAELVWTYKI